MQRVVVKGTWTFAVFTCKYDRDPTQRVIHPPGAAARHLGRVIRDVHQRAH